MGAPVFDIARFKGGNADPTHSIQPLHNTLRQPQSSVPQTMSTRGPAQTSTQAYQPSTTPQPQQQPPFTPGAMPIPDQPWAPMGVSPSRSLPPQGPGTRVLTNLILNRKFGAKKGMTGDQAPQQQEAQLSTSSQGALKLALSVLGVSSDKNKLGMNLPIGMARSVWFGPGAKVTNTDEAQFRAIMDGGDKSVDEKRVRQFVNFDGSTTWEVLNPDKTVMSRFTLGEFNGKKVFVQGGYSSYADQLKKIVSQGGSAMKANTSFDKMQEALKMGMK